MQFEIEKRIQIIWISFYPAQFKLQSKTIKKDKQIQWNGAVLVSTLLFVLAKTTRNRRRNSLKWRFGVFLNKRQSNTLKEKNLCKQMFLLSSLILILKQYSSQENLAEHSFGKLGMTGLWSNFTRQERIF